MSDSINTAKKRIILNMTSNVIGVLIVSFIGIWLTPYLIRNLGVEVYGMIPLASSIASYCGLISKSISSSVGRFVVINANVGEINKSNEYFNSAFFGLLLMYFIIVVPVLIFALNVHMFFNIPLGYTHDFTIMFVFVLISSFLIGLTSPFAVSTFITHSFYLENLAKILSRLIQIITIILLFKYFGSSLSFFGFGLLCMSASLLFFYMLFSKKLTPQLKLERRSYHWSTLKEMMGMGGWVVVDQIGTLLYLNTDLIIINILLGPKQVGLYAPLLQLVLLMRIFAPAIGGVFAPVAIEFVAKSEFLKLANYTKKTIKFMGLLLALPIGLLCGFSAPFLDRWLGASFAHLGPLAWLLLCPQVVLLAMNPLYNVNRGLNKVKIPALVTLCGGIVNILLSVMFIMFTNLGLYGVALATIIAFGLRTIVFQPIYTAKNIQQKPFIFIKASMFGVLMFLIVSSSSYILKDFINLISYTNMIILGIIISCCHFLICYLFMLNDDERILVISLFRRNNRMAFDKNI